MSLSVSRIKNQIQNDGLISFLRGAVFYTRNNTRFLLEPLYQRVLEPLYQRVKPSWTELTCQGYSVDMSMELAKYNSYDFRDDFESEEEVLSHFLSELQPDDMVWDVGANVGIYTCFAAAVDDNIDVVSFEPHPKIADILRENRARNNVDGAVVEAALGDSRTSIELTEVGDTAHTMMDRDEESSGKVTVDSIVGDDILDEYSSPTVMKIDVEGAELKVIEGLEQFLSQNPPRLIYLENHNRILKRAGHTGDVVANLLRSHGYDLETIMSRRDNSFVVARQ